MQAVSQSIQMNNDLLQTIHDETTDLVKKALIVREEAIAGAAQGKGHQLDVSG